MFHFVAGVVVVRKETVEPLRYPIYATFTRPRHTFFQGSRQNLPVVRFS